MTMKSKVNNEIYKMTLSIDLNEKSFYTSWKDKFNKIANIK